ncbi:MAG: type II secretion system protein GspC [Candidatus Binatia bacterium]
MQELVVLRRYSRLGRALLIALTAYAGAVTLNSAIALWLERGIPDAAPVTATDREGSPALVRTSGPDHTAIFQRNLFGSEPIVVAAAPGEAPTSTVAPGDLRLRGTAELDGRAFAVFEDGAGGRQDVYAIGERVFGGPKLIAVKPGKATLVLRGRKFTLEISKPEPASASVEKGKNPGSAGGPGSGIRKTGENSYLVDRREVDHSVENLNSVITQMRAVPFLKDGKGIGFRIFNIKPGSIFERMGLKDGDVVQSVNGVELNTPSKAIGLLDDMQTMDEIAINLLRSGQAQTLTYAIQ